MGLRGCGKTRLLKTILNPLPDRLVVIDTLGELSFDGFVEGVSPEEFRRVLLQSNTYHVGIAPHDADVLDWASQACAARRNITLAVDELDLWYPTAVSLPNHAINNIALTGRHYEQSFIGVVHRPSCVHHNILSQCTMWVFPMIDALDCQTVLRYSKRLNAPLGCDPSSLRVLEYSGQHVVRTEVARVGREGLQVLDFNLVTGELHTT